MNNDMRYFINTISTPINSQIDEGIIDSIKNWINSLNSPVKSRGLELVNRLEGQLTSKYGAHVSKQIKSSNPSWMWSRLTYQNLYKFATQVSGFDDTELDRALKNPIVTNNLRQLYRSPSAGGDTGSMSLPLKSNIIKNNNDFISTVVDTETKQYLSKAIASAILDGLAYIDQEKKDNVNHPRSTSDTNTTDQSQQNIDEPISRSEPELSIDDLKSAILLIRQGLAKIGGTP